MDTINNKISRSQLLFLISSFMLGSTSLISFMDVIAHHDTWLVIIASIIIGIPFVLSYSALAKKFPEKSLIQIINIIYGPYLGKLFSILYTSYFYLLFSLNLLSVTNFYTAYIMPETPSPVFVIMFVLVSGYAVRKGIEGLARVSYISVFWGIAVAVLSTLLLAKEADFSNFLPVFEIPTKDFIQSIHIVLTIPFCEIVVFLMVTSSLNRYTKIHKYTLWGYLIASLCMLIIAVRNTATLGSSSLLYVNASYQSIRLINIADFLTRIEVLIALSLTFCLFIKICILYYVTVLGISQLFNLRSYSPLILPIGGIAVISALTFYDSALEHFIFARIYHVIWPTPFLLIFPPVSLLIAKLRRLPKHPGGENQ